MWQQEPDGRVSHPFEPLLLALTLLVIPVVIIEESSAPHGVKVAAQVANWVIWLGFLVEVVAVLVVADRKRDALKAYWLETLVVVGTVPFYPCLLQSGRLFRLTRLLLLARLGLLGGVPAAELEQFNHRLALTLRAMVAANPLRGTPEVR